MSIGRNIKRLLPGVHSEFNPGRMHAQRFCDPRKVCAPRGPRPAFPVVHPLSAVRWDSYGICKLLLGKAR